MQQITFFLEKFKSLGLETVAVKTVFVETVEKILNTKLPLESVTLKDGVISVKAHPVLKSELYMKRSILVSELSKILGPTKITNLR
ncbi:MAG: hypothetical protein AAB511_01135 [Patescibacteria group bacterium]